MDDFESGLESIADQGADAGADLGGEDRVADDLEGWAATDARFFPSHPDNREEPDTLETESDGDQADTLETESSRDDAPQQVSSAYRYGEQDYLRGVAFLDKEMDALAEKYESGEIEFSEFRKQERGLLEQRDTLMSAARSVNRERTTAWDSATRAFLSDPSNSAFADGGPLNSSLQAAMNRRLAADRTKYQGVAGYRSLMDESAAEIRSAMRQSLGNAGASPALEQRARNEKRAGSAASTPTPRGRSNHDPFAGWAAEF